MVNRKHVFLIFLLYAVSVVPYIVHSNAERAGVGIVSAVKKISIEEIPEDLMSIFPESGEVITALLIENPVSGEKHVLLSASSHSFARGDVVEIHDSVAEWFVDWHAYDFLGEPFSKLIIGSARHISDFEACVERMLASPLGTVAFALSALSFFLAPLFISFFIAGFRLRLWLFPLILSIYAAQVIVSNIVAQMHSIQIDDLSRYFGYSFIILAFLAAAMCRYERSGGADKIYEIISSAFSRFSR